MMKLPSHRTICKWVQPLDFVPGINASLFTALKAQVETFNDYEKNCTFIFDETYLRPHFDYDKFKDKIVGVQDHGSNRRHFVNATQALALFVHGLSTGYKYPIGYYFSEHSCPAVDLVTITTEMFKELVKIGLKPRISICDMGICNQSLYKRWGVRIDKPYVTIAGSKMYCVFDTPHLIKLVRDHMAKHEFLVDGHLVSMRHVKEFFELDEVAIGRTCPKLTPRHFDAKGLDKMKVFLATQVLSRSVMVGMKYDIRNNNLPAEYEHTANFCGKMDRLFDLLNISKDIDPAKPWKSGRQIFENRQELLELKYWVSTWKMYDGARLPDCVYGLQLTLQGIHDLIVDLHFENFVYIRTRIMQTDPLEHFFGFLKRRPGSGPKLTAMEFGTNFRYLFISGYLRNPKGGNCEFAEDLDGYEQHNELFVKMITQVKTAARELRENFGSDLESEDDEFESDDSQSSCDENMSFDRTQFYRQTETPTELELRDENVAIYMGCAATKKVLKTTHKNPCLDCHALLEFTADRTTHQYTADESLTVDRASTPHVLQNMIPLGYSQMLREPAKTFYKQVALLFESARDTKQNVYACRIRANITATLLNDPIIHDFCNPPSDNCKTHRKLMLDYFLKAKIFDMVKRLNYPNRVN